MKEERAVESNEFCGTLYNINSCNRKKKAIKKVGVNHAPTFLFFSFDIYMVFFAARIAMMRFISL